MSLICVCWSVFGMIVCQVGILGNAVDFYDSGLDSTADSKTDRRQLMIAFDVRCDANNLINSVELESRSITSNFPFLIDALGSSWQKWCCESSWTLQSLSNSSLFSPRQAKLFLYLVCVFISLSRKDVWLDSASAGLPYLFN